MVGRVGVTLVSQERVSTWCMYTLIVILYEWFCIVGGLVLVGVNYKLQRVLKNDTPGLS